MALLEVLTPEEKLAQTLVAVAVVAGGGADHRAVMAAAAS
jgi:hypothetical protein